MLIPIRNVLQIRQAIAASKQLIAPPVAQWRPGRRLVHVIFTLFLLLILSVRDVRQQVLEGRAR